MGSVLLIDDDAAIRTVVAEALRRAGHQVTSTASLAEAGAALTRATPDLLVTDVVLPDGDGLDHLRNLAERHPSLPAIVLSAQNTLSTAVRANEAGAYEYLPKPFDLDALTAAVAAALARTGTAVTGGVGEADRALPLLGRSPAMQEVYRVLARVVATDLTVLVSGESGTGKELVARALHDLGGRRAGPFVAINMAAIPRELIEAELFGHERGVFTGAAARAAGRFEQAREGTLFLDEIGDMPLDAQTRLLRVLQSGEFTAVGGARPVRADVRIVAATNRDLAALIASGRFREDLYYRLAVVPLARPPLRHRRGDPPLLAAHSLDRAADEGLPRRRLERAALRPLEAHDWPGNVRELENLLRRLSLLARDDVIREPEVRAALGEPIAQPACDLAAAVRAFVERAPDDGAVYDRLLVAVERPLIEAMLARHGGNQLRAARALGLNRNTLRKRLDALGLSSQRPDGTNPR